MLRPILVLAALLAVVSLGPICNSTEIESILRNADTVSETRTAIHEYADQGSEEQAIASAFCSVATPIINQDVPESDQEWASALAQEAAGRAGIAYAQLLGKAEEFSAAAQLSQSANPGVGARYLQYCNGG